MKDFLNVKTKTAGSGSNSCSKVGVLGTKDVRLTFEDQDQIAPLFIPASSQCGAARGNASPQKAKTKPPVVTEEPRMSTGNATSRVKDFFWETLTAVTNSCIATLELLAAGKTVHADVEKEGMSMLAGRCQALQ
jgi:hypothetical protein